MFVSEKAVADAGGSVCGQTHENLVTSHLCGFRLLILFYYEREREREREGNWLNLHSEVALYENSANFSLHGRRTFVG